MKNGGNKRINPAGLLLLFMLVSDGAWDKRPMPLGGRALELKAWEDFNIKRKQGETDTELRRRCMAAADTELANTPPEGGKPYGI